MSSFICCVAVSPVRKEPNHRSEMISQQLFGEECLAIQETDEWYQIHMKWDGYVGWVTKNHVLKMDTELNECHLISDWIGKATFKNGIIQLPMGSDLSHYQKNESNWLGYPFSFEGELWKPSNQQIDSGKIEKLAKQFLNTPYLWGGRSVFGVDCSGFVQIVYKFFNIPLPRDSSKQALEGEEIQLKDAHCGDLAFFQNERGVVTHVGLLLDNQTIIHASGHVRIDPINTEGIFSADTGLQTHRLYSVRKYF